MLTKILVFLFCGSLAYMFTATVFLETDSNMILLAGVVAVVSLVAAVLSNMKYKRKSSSDRAIEGYRRRDKRRKEWM